MAGIRRTWDKALYEQRARDRLEKGDDFIEESKNPSGNRAKQALREEFRTADANSSGPIGSERAFLKSREGRLGLDEKAGKIEIINPTDSEGNKAGFWCEVCSVLLKDSASYLAHINGKKHQHALGFSMRVERANVDDVKERLQRLKSRSNNKRTHEDTETKSVLQEYNDKLKSEEMKEEEMKRKRKEENESRKKRKANDAESEKAKKNEITEDSNYPENEEEDEMAKLMGFKGFGSSKK